MSGVPDFFPINNNTVTHDKTDSWSVYGQYDFDLTDQVTLVSGLRYTKEKRDFNMTWSTTAASFPTPPSSSARPPPAISPGTIPTTCPIVSS